MSRLTVPTWVTQLVIGLMLILLASRTVAQVGEQWVGITLGSSLAVVLVAWLAFGRSRSSGESDDEPAETDDEDDAGGNSVWNAIPSHQYTGRHVESGGLARDDQEKALAEIQEQAREQAPEEFRD